jgi:hypothetical protein
MNALILILLLVPAGLMIGPAIRHDNDQPIQVTGKARK